MPQMSSMDWLMLMLYFFYLYYLSIVVIYFNKEINYYNNINLMVIYGDKFKILWY